MALESQAQEVLELDLQRTDYALEKLGLAADALATERGRIVERVTTAMYKLSAVTEEDLPEKLKEKFRWLSKVTNEGFDEEVGVQAANAILELHGRLEGYRSDAERPRST
jgi:hypothetical protein